MDLEGFPVNNGHHKCNWHLSDKLLIHNCIGKNLLILQIIGCSYHSITDAFLIIYAKNHISVSSRTVFWAEIELFIWGTSLYHLSICIKSCIFIMISNKHLLPINYKGYIDNNSIQELL